MSAEQIVWVFVLVGIWSFLRLTTWILGPHQGHHPEIVFSRRDRP